MRQIWTVKWWHPAWNPQPHRYQELSSSRSILFHQAYTPLSGWHSSPLISLWNCLNIHKSTIEVIPRLHRIVKKFAAVVSHRSDNRHQDSHHKRSNSDQEQNSTWAVHQISKPISMEETHDYCSNDTQYTQDYQHCEYCLQDFGGLPCHLLAWVKLRC